MGRRPLQWLIIDKPSASSLKKADTIVASMEKMMVARGMPRLRKIWFDGESYYDLTFSDYLNRILVWGEEKGAPIFFAISNSNIWALIKSKNTWTKKLIAPGSPLWNKITIGGSYYQAPEGTLLKSYPDPNRYFFHNQGNPFPSYVRSGGWRRYTSTYGEFIRGVVDLPFSSSLRTDHDAIITVEPEVGCKTIFNGRELSTTITMGFVHIFDDGSKGMLLYCGYSYIAFAPLTTSGQLGALEFIPISGLPTGNIIKLSSANENSLRVAGCTASFNQSTGIYSNQKNIIIEIDYINKTAEVIDSKDQYVDNYTDIVEAYSHEYTYETAVFSHTLNTVNREEHSRSLLEAWYYNANNELAIIEFIMDYTTTFIESYANDITVDYQGTYAEQIVTTTNTVNEIAEWNKIGNIVLKIGGTSVYNIPISGESSAANTHGYTTVQVFRYGNISSSSTSTNSSITKNESEDTPIVLFTDLDARNSTCTFSLQNYNVESSFSGTTFPVVGSLDTTTYSSEKAYINNIFVSGGETYSSATTEESTLTRIGSNEFGVAVPKYCDPNATVDNVSTRITGGGIINYYDQTTGTPNRFATSAEGDTIFCSPQLQQIIPNWYTAGPTYFGIAKPDGTLYDISNLGLVDVEAIGICEGLTI